jgi:hypothetical protein
MIRVSLMLRCALVLGVASLAEISFAEDFLVRQDGSSLTQEVHNGDPTSFDVVYWEIHFRSKYGIEHGGALIDKTYDGLMREVKVMQKCDLFYTRAMHVDVESFDNYMHPGPPIAVLKRTDTPKSKPGVAVEILKKIQDLKERYEEAKNAWNEAADAWNVLTGNWEKVEVKEGGAMEKVGRVIGEYTGNFRDVFGKLMKLKAYMNEHDDLSGLGNTLAEFESSLSVMEESGRRAAKALNDLTASPSPSPSPNQAVQQSSTPVPTTLQVVPNV